MVRVALSGWATATVAGQWLPPPATGTLPCGWTTGVPRSLTSVHTSHSSAQNEYKHCVWCGKIHLTDSGLACGVVTSVDTCSLPYVIECSSCKQHCNARVKFLQQSCLSLKMELLRSFAASENIYQITWSNIRGDLSLLCCYDFMKKFAQFN